MTPVQPIPIYKNPPAIEMPSLVSQILDAQQDDGAILWWSGHKVDPWDHVESIMGLTTGGAFHQAQKGFEWLVRNQLPDGSWYSSYQNGQPLERTRETHHAAYVAVGLYHYFLATGDDTLIADMWETVHKAMGFALRYQTAQGSINWALAPDGRPDKMALLTGCSSIRFSLECALRLAEQMGHPYPEWQSASDALTACICLKPHCFNMTKARYAMDWYYPVLCGAIKGIEADDRIKGQWKKFVIENMGVRCVSDQPWVTVAETCEFILTLTAMGRPAMAKILFNWISGRIFDDGTFWCGFTVPDMAVWPEDKISWTNAAVLLAADAVFDLTPAAGLFRRSDAQRCR